jgi:hypothetical protein
LNPSARAIPCPVKTTSGRIGVGQRSHSRSQGLLPAGELPPPRK